MAIYRVKMKEQRHLNLHVVDCSWRQERFSLCKEVKEALQVWGLAQHGSAANTEVLFAGFNLRCARLK